MAFIRTPHNPIIKPRDLKPSRADFEVIGTFNAGVTRHQNEIVLLIRVAERPLQIDDKATAYPHMKRDGEIQVRIAPHNDDRYEFSDPRMIIDRQSGETTLTSISHIRLGRSTDGIHFSIDDLPWLQAVPPYESFGVEDARITCIEGEYYINYSAVSPLGISTGLIKTRDFVSTERCGIIFPPANRDVVLFSERIHGHYVCYHRPMPTPFGDFNIWMATSSDLKQWGQHQLVLQVDKKGWEGGRVGGGAPPIRTQEGWLSIYHAADKQQRYCLGAFLTPLDAPDKIIRRSPKPILMPESPYETDGFFGNVVFSCGALLEEEILYLYYGAADETLALAQAPLDQVLKQLDPV